MTIIFKPENYYFVNKELLKEIGITPVIVYHLLVDQKEEQGDTFHISYGQMEKENNYLTKGKIQKALEILERKGYIEIEKGKGKRNQPVNFYRILKEGD